MKWIAVLLAAPAAWGLSCTVSGSGAAFGNYSTISGQPADTLGTVTVTCTGTEGENVNLSLALSSGHGTYASRTMIGGSTALHYNLYTDASRAIVWGDGQSGTGIVSDSFQMGSPLVVKNYTLYARIIGSQNQTPSDGYGDTIVVTLTY
jgi:spore coat protein U-like protein